MADHLGIGGKGDAILKVQGMNALAMKQAGLYDALVSYALNDVELCRKIWDALQPFPMEELVLCDTIQRCTLNPQFVLDPNVLHEHLHITKQAVNKAVKQLKQAGYIEVVSRGFRGERADTIRVVFDGDGDLDAIEGELDGTLNYYMSVVPNTAPTAVTLTNQTSTIPENKIGRAHV